MRKSVIISSSGWTHPGTGPRHNTDRAVNGARQVALSEQDCCLSDHQRAARLPRSRLVLGKASAACSHPTIQSRSKVGCTTRCAAPPYRTVVDRTAGSGKIIGLEETVLFTSADLSKAICGRMFSVARSPDSQVSQRRDHRANIRRRANTCARS
jgi:hypothetical protein